MNLSTGMLGSFLAMPFISSMRHKYNNKNILSQIKYNLNIKISIKKPKILWFSDTINDLNGVSEILKEIGWQAQRNNIKVKILTSLNADKIDNSIPNNVVCLPELYDFELPYYNPINLHIPSILKTLEIIYENQPDKIYISTPGPIGLVGLLEAQACNLPVVVYDIGGPKEVMQGETGYIAKSNDLDEWVNTIVKLIEKMDMDNHFNEEKLISKDLVLNKFSWMTAFDEFKKVETDFATYNYFQDPNPSEGIVKNYPSLELIDD